MVKNNCPNCDTELLNTPSRKTKCKNCGKYMIIRTHPYTNKKLLLTVDEAKEIDRLWEEKRKEVEVIEILSKYKLTKNDLNKKIEVLRQKYPNKNIDFKEATWWFLSDLNFKFFKEGKLDELTSIYWDKAYFLFFIENRNYYNEMLAYHELQLYKIKNDGYNKVKIITSGIKSCEVCNKNNNVVLTVKEALEKKLIPCRNCTNFSNRNNKGIGWCRCLYVPVL